MSLEKERFKNDHSSLHDLIYIYCDESCHLENDHKPNMVLGAIACPKSYVKTANAALRKIKEKHGLKGREVKWHKVSPSKTDFYIEYINYFFNTDELRFRGLLAPKNQLNHSRYSQTHDGWYYKMYYLLIDALINNQNQFHVFLDIKDTSGVERRRRLREVICNTHHDFDSSLIRDIQAIRSDEVELVQLTDLLIGAIMSTNNVQQPCESTAKIKIINTIKSKSRYNLTLSTPRGERKFNLFHWQPETESDS
jgi:hypothetical protein